MFPALPAPRLGVALASCALLTTFALSGCGSPGSGPGGGGAATPASSGTPAPSASTARTSGGTATSTPATTTAAAATPTTPTATQPAGGPVPGGFAASSVTFVSADEAFVLGTAPCSHPPCTSIVRTLDRGASWAGLPAPVVPLGQQNSASGPAVWGIRFADPMHGFVFGNGLWETTDGGEHWAATAGPQGWILSLEVIDGQVLALTASCQPQNGCAQTGLLMRRAVSGGSWYKVASVGNPRMIATQKQTAALVDGTGVLVTTDGGRTVAEHATPCTTQGVAIASQVAVTGADSLALLCAGQGYTGHENKTVYVSGDLGAHWTMAASPASGGDPQAIAAGTPARIVVAAESAASWLYYSADSAANWGTAYFAGDGGQGWNDLGFTTTSDGVVVHGPALDDGNRSGRPGQLLLTSDGGATWNLVRF